MQLYRYKIDSTIYDAYDINLKWARKNDINPANYRRELTGSVKFAEDVYNYIDSTSDVYFDFSVEQLKTSDSSWNQIWVGYFDRRYCVFDENKKTVIVSKYTPNFDNTDIVLSKLDEEIPWFRIKNGSPSYINTIIGTNEPSVTLNLYVNPAGAGLTHAQYRAAYDINGYPLNAGEVDANWAQIIDNGFISTVPQFQTMSFEWRPLNYTSFTEVDIWIYDGTAWELKVRWIKLPPSLGAVVNSSPYITATSIKLGEFINSFLSELLIPLTFDIFTDITYTGIDFHNTLIDQAVNLYDFASDYENITLGDLLESLEKMGMYWYTDSGHLKFLHESELTSSGTLDLTSETSNSLTLTPIESNIPDIEKWTFKDSEASRGSGGIFGTLQIKYEDNIYSLNEVKRYDIGFYTNVPSLIRKKIRSEDNGIALIHVIDDLSTASQPFTISGADSTLYNWEYSMNNFRDTVGYYRYWSSGTYTSGLKPVLAFITRPLFRLTQINYNQLPTEILTDFDLNVNILTNAGNGKVYDFRCDLRTNNKTLTIDLR